MIRRSMRRGGRSAAVATDLTRKRIMARPFDRLDDEANKARDSGRRLVASALLASVAAATLEIIPWHIGEIDVSAFGSAVAFAVAFTLSARLARRRPDRMWHRRRAVVEAAVGIQWQWALGIGEFSNTDEVAEAAFVARLQGLATDGGFETSEVDIEPCRRLRSGCESDRLGRYLISRLDDQLSFYRRRSRESVLLGRTWTTAALAAQGLGLAAAVLKGLGWIEVDLLGIAATLATAAAAWTRARDHAELGDIYRAMCRTLRAESALLRSHTGSPPVIVARIEAALATEHARWLERRSQLGLQIT
jgi:hypothetical protein